MPTNIIDCIHFFNDLQVYVRDITTAEQKDEGKKVVEAEYHYKDKVFKTQPLYYQEVTELEDVKDIDDLHDYYGPEVYWLDLDKHKWPKPAGQSDLDTLVINDIYQPGDEDFKNFLLQLANNQQTGYIQLITQEGRPTRYFHNLENNNHWHDLVLLIKAAINSRGDTIDKKYFEHLVYRWQKDMRVTLGFGANDNTFKMIQDLYNNIKVIQTSMNTDELIKLLRYKRQIILQGPPGTGKTKLAKEIAEKLARPNQITIADIRKVMAVNQTVYSISDKIPYKVKRINDTGIELLLENGNIQQRSYTSIIEGYNNYIAQKPLTGGDAYQAAIAKYIAEHIKDDTCKIIQFHPSYSYEDFVRGIVAESNGNQIEYKNVNKILGQLAEDAYENYQLSQQDYKEVQQDRWVNEYFQEFKEVVDTEVGEAQFLITDTIGIFKVEQDCFKYGKDWGNPSRINFIDFKKLIKAKLNGSLRTTDTTIPNTLSAHAHRRAPYYMALLRIFFNRYATDPSTEKEPLKNYVLIIDEINRGNLSSVLGELIYAMEYRGEKVNSMYAIDGKNELVLPPNLYIIGTMNSADRNVKHIDYAIRRRFSFVDVPPKDLSGEPGIIFHSGLFNKVANLFKTNCSLEFKPEAVQLGHSYFIDDAAEGGPIDIRLKYEIIPILMEYVKDGVLVGDVAVAGGISVEKYILSLSI